MNYLFLDRIVRLEANRQIVALKNVTLSEDVFRDHFAGFPVMPGALMIEALAQAATALLEVSCHYRKKALPAMLDQVKFRALVRPGDQLKLTVNVRSLDAATAQMDGTITSGDRLVMTGLLTFALRDAAAFYPEKFRFVIESIYDFWLRDAELVGLDRKEPEP